MMMANGNAPRYVVRLDDPCVVGRYRFPRERGFEVQREADRYASRAIRYGLRPEIVPYDPKPKGRRPAARIAGSS